MTTAYGRRVLYHRGMECEITSKHLEWLDTAERDLKRAPELAEENERLREALSDAGYSPKQISRIAQGVEDVA